MSEIVARKTLSKAQYFLGQAQQAEFDPGISNNRLPFVANLEAAIVYGRSVTFHIQKQFKHRAGFDDWYEKIQVHLDDALCKYFLDRRNFILKEGPVELLLTINVEAEDNITLTDTAQVTIVRGQSWYRRSRAILWEDLTLAVRTRLTNWPRQRAARLAVSRPAPASRPNQPTQQFHFAEAPGDQEPATQLVGKYLNRLGPAVAGAEGRWPAAP